MINSEMEFRQINDIVKKTISSIEDSKKEIYIIVENARNTVEIAKMQIKGVQEEIIKIISEVDDLEVKYKIARNKLAEVSRNFSKYSEIEVKSAYDNANNIRTSIMLKNQEEMGLKDKRKALEFGLKRAQEVLESAKKLIGNVGIAIDFLSGPIKERINSASDPYWKLKMLEAREEERRRISRDIHDGPAQSMANIVFKAEILKKVMEKNIEESMKEVDELKGMVQKSLNEVRGIIYDLRPMSIDDIGILETIRKYLSDFEDDTQINVKVNIKNESDSIVDKIIEIATFRIVQEIFNNIRKHSKAKSANLTMEVGTKYMRITVRDDGIGFDYNNVLKTIKEENNSFGLLGISERVQSVGGNIKYISIKGKGTEIVVKMPITKEVIFDEYEDTGSIG